MADHPNDGAVIGGRYRLGARLGGGGAGSVYRAFPVDGGPAVALKLVDPRVAGRAAMRDRFEREARALNGLEHPHLIRLIDFGFHEGAPYLVTELLEGMPLDRLLLSRPLPSAIAFEIGLGVVAGLAYAHAHGVLHRDLKPGNVFVAALPGGVLHPKVLDFGLARFVDSTRWGRHSTLTEEGAVIGTPAYMAPEQGFGGRADARSDVYSAGVVLYELISARPPFVHDNNASLIRAHALDPVPPIGEVRRDLAVQPALEALLARALAKDPKDRFPDAGAMLRAMQEIPEPPAAVHR
jgi:serine/threonine-protein kinase